MLCPDCEQLPLSILKGSCMECGAETNSEDHLYCEDCSLEQDSCQVCLDELGIMASAVTINPGVFMVLKEMKDSGSTIKLKVGDELHITLDVTNSFTYAWYCEYKHDRKVIDSQSIGPFIPSPNPQHWGKGTQLMIFKAKAPGTTRLSFIEDENSSSPWGGGGPSGVTWAADIQVK